MAAVAAAKQVTAQQFEDALNQIKNSADGISRFLHDKTERDDGIRLVLAGRLLDWWTDDTREWNTFKTRQIATDYFATLSGAELSKAQAQYDTARAQHSQASDLLIRCHERLPYDEMSPQAQAMSDRFARQDRERAEKQAREKDRATKEALERLDNQKAWEALKAQEKV
jgi:hypothetical protein